MKHFKLFFLYSLFELPVFFLIMQKGRRESIISIIIYLFICLFIAKHNQNYFEKTLFKPTFPFSTLIITLLLSVTFFLRWHNTNRIISLSQILKMPHNQICLIISLLLFSFSNPGIDILLRTFCTTLGIHNHFINEKIRKMIQTHLIIFITSFLTITINSESSPLYPFNNWADPNATFTVGKGVLKGFIPYRDLFDHKGPLMIFLQSIGAFFSFNSFIGVWFIEICFSYIFLLLAYKTLFLFFGKNSIFVIPFISAFVYSSMAFQTGDSAEEFCLPLITYGVYIGCKAIQNNQLPSKKEFYLIGVTSACVFWINFQWLVFIWDG